MVTRVLKKQASNYLPWLVVICWGLPIQATQTETRALVTASVVMSDRGSALGQRVYLSMAVRHYRKPEETHNGPTTSICTRETCQQEVETSKRGLYVPRYLGSLAGCARAYPCVAVFPHSRPHKPLGHQLDGGIGPGVAKAVEGVKDLESERCGYEWMRLWN
jgi:hypothetical protein